jgi:hypothetical protein
VIPINGVYTMQLSLLAAGLLLLGCAFCQSSRPETVVKWDGSIIGEARFCLPRLNVGAIENDVEVSNLRCDFVSHNIGTHPANGSMMEVIFQVPRFLSPALKSKQGLRKLFGRQACAVLCSDGILCCPAGQNCFIGPGGVFGCCPVGQICTAIAPSCAESPLQKHPLILVPRTIFAPIPCHAALLEPPARETPA